MNKTIAKLSKPPSFLANEAARLIQRYPRLGDQELERLIEIFPRVSIVEVALMICDDDLAGKLDAFQREHGHKLRNPLSHILIFLTVPTILLFGIFYGLWDLIGAS